MKMKNILVYLLIAHVKYVHLQNSETFICIDGNEISFTEVCNGIKNCPDGSDETKNLCFHIICPVDYFRCYYGACIKKAEKCNGIPECVDKSDESQCGKQAGSCEENDFRCGSGECIPMNQTCDGKLHCQDRSDENKDTCEDWLCPENSFRCHRGGCIHKEAQCNNVKDCPDGSDELDLLCKSLKCQESDCDNVRKDISCPPIISSRIEVHCAVEFGVKKGVVPCDKPVPVGTVAKYQCKLNYKPANEKHMHNKQSHCQMDGTWNRDFVKCEPACGKREFDVTTLIVNGWYPAAGQWPWHAVMYMEEEGEWAFSCGGTLISEKVVLTAAHCTWKISPENLKIALGKHFSDFKKNEDFTVIRDIESIIMQPVYQDISGNYGSDISVLVLTEPVVFSEFIRPICIDWESVYVKEQLTSDNLGLIVGMGITENDTFSDVLKATYLPVVSENLCIEQQKRDFKKYITYTTFCAGWKNGTGVCNGDSGGGLVFQNPTDKDQWYLQGIVSISPRRHGTSFCDPQYYTVFTKVTKFLDWLMDVIGDIHPDRFKNNFLTNVAF